MSADTLSPRTTAGRAELPSPALRLLLTADEVAVRLGIGKRTVWTWDAAGRLPEPVRIGTTVRWRAAELEAWTAAGCPPRADWAALQRRTNREGATRG